MIKRLRTNIEISADVKERRMGEEVTNQGRNGRKRLKLKVCWRRERLKVVDEKIITKEYWSCDRSEERKKWEKRRKKNR